MSHKVTLLLATLALMLCTVSPAGANSEGVIVFAVQESGNWEMRLLNPVTLSQSTIYSTTGTIARLDVSPNGRTIAFSDDSSGYNEIYVIDVDGTNLAQVTSDGSSAVNFGNYHPGWKDNDTIFYSTTRLNVGQRELVKIHKDGTGMQILTNGGGTTGGFSYHYGAMSPDGSQWAYIKGTPYDASSDKGYVNDYPNFNNDTLICDIDGNLGSDAPREWCGTEVLCEYSKEGANYTLIYTVQSDGSNLDTLSADGNDLDNRPDLSESCSQIAFWSREDGTANVWTMNDDGSNRQQLTFMTGSVISGNLDWTTHHANVHFPSLATLPCDNECLVQPVMAECSEPMNGAQLCLEVPTGVEICSVSTFGTICDGWAYNYVDYSKWADSGFIFVALADDFDQIPADTSTLFYIHYYMPPLCNQNQYVQWDTAQSHVETRQLVFSDSANQRALPFFDRNQDSTEILGYMPGDCNNDESLDIADLTCMVDKMFKGGEVCVVNAIRVNGDAFLDISDLTYMVAYMFKSGPAPLCPGVAPKVVVDRFVGISLNRSKGKTVINLSSSIDLSGLELTLAGAGNSSANLVNLAGIDLIDGEVNGLTRIGLLDLEGDNVIPSGEYAIIQLDGEFELVDARASDLQHRSLAIIQGAAASGNDPSLPLEFTLSQNYPNPFNPTTEIGFSLPDAGHVTLEVYNIVGQRIEVLVDGTRETGHHVVEWDAGRYASGVYLYRLTAGDFVETRRMVLVK